jgi:hypothetical protein
MIRLSPRKNSRWSCRQSYSQNKIIPLTFLCEPIGRMEIFHTFSLLVEIEGHFTHEFVSYVCETEDLYQHLLIYWPMYSKYEMNANPKSLRWSLSFLRRVQCTNCSLRPYWINKKKIRALKGQCNEMVVEISPWSHSLGLNLRLGILFSVYKSAVLKLCSLD